MSAPGTTPSGPPVSILLVDDDALVREATAWMLTEAGHEVIEAEGAEAALQHLEHRGPFGLLITDINMPGMDGADLARHVRARWPGQPVLLVSGRPQPPGAEPFMPKPFGWNALMEAVAKVIHPGLKPPQATPHTSKPENGDQS